MIRTVTILLFFFFLTIVACQIKKQDKLSNNSINQDQDFLTVPFDSAQVLASLNISEKVDRLHLLELDKNEDLKEDVDTLELMHVAYACDCQDWVDPVEYNSFYQQDFPDRKDSEETYVDFNLIKFGYYIEPADSELAITWNAYVTGNIVRFIGKEHKDLGYPENAHFITPDPPKGKVFRYYSYEIQKPYRVWCPKIFKGIQEETGDTMYTPCTLIIN